jgi:hypothetical protein
VILARVIPLTYIGRLLGGFRSAAPFRFGN